MRRLERHREEALSNIVRRSYWDLSFAPRDHETCEYRGHALFINDALERIRPMRKWDDISLERAARPACLPRVHRPALVLWQLWRYPARAGKRRIHAHTECWECREPKVPKVESVENYRNYRRETRLRERPSVRRMYSCATTDCPLPGEPWVV